MQTPNSQELRKTEEAKIIDQMVADLPILESLRDLILEVKAKFGQNCQEKIDLCEAFASKWDSKISDNDGRNKALRTLFERQIERQESIMRMVEEMVIDSQTMEAEEN